MRRPITLPIVILFLLIPLFQPLAGTTTYTYMFDSPRIVVENGKATVTLEGAPCWADPGEPLLPTKAVHLLLPPGEEAYSITLETGEAVGLGKGYEIRLAEQQQPISSMTESESVATPARKTHPDEISESLKTHYLYGHGIATALIAPVTWDAQSGEIAYFPWIRVNINTRPSSKGQNAYQTMLKRSTAQIDRVQKSVHNSEMVSIYGSTPLLDTEEWEMLVITRNEFVDDYQEFIDYKNQSGIAATVETVEDIYSQYTGIDNQDKIRNCIIEYYQNYDISYVFLCGDNEDIPCRSLWVQAGEYEADIPSDLYYAGLDGNWNDDGDDHWGEYDEADFFAEVFVGRSCADNLVEIINFTNKTMQFESSPVVSEVETGLMIGEDMGWSSWGWEYKEEIRLGSSNYGYTTAGFPISFSVDTLYDYSGYSWSALSDLLPHLNDGPQLVNHMGHASWNYVLKFDLDEIDDNNFTNNGIDHNYFIGYSQGCHAGNFEHNNEDCIIEAFTTIAHGAVAFVANSRYGWGVYSGTNGASQRFDREFFDAIFGENLTRIAWTNQDSKEDNVAWAEDDYIRWCYYELNLFGDPTLDIWTEQPTLYNPSYEEAVLTGTDFIEISDISVNGSLVTISQNGMILGQGESNFTGTALVLLDSPLQQTGTLDLMITHQNMVPYTGTIEVIEPYIALTPASTPITIPSSGGDFDFNIEVSNNSDLEVMVDIWCDITLPDSSIYGPVIGPVTGFYLPANWSTSRDRSQTVPGSAPSGTYSYNAYIGTYPDIISSQDSFEFEKTGSDRSGNTMIGWFSSGDSFELITPGIETELPSIFKVYPPHPNPFNPVTVISFQLPAVSFVNLAVYDVAGRQVAELVHGWRNEGIHEVSFDASELASGIYIYRLKGEQSTFSGKMILMK